MKNWNKYFRKGYFDLVITNPPFFKFYGEQKQLNDLDQLSLARHEISINLDSLIETASNLLKIKDILLWFIELIGLSILLKL